MNTVILIPPSEGKASGGEYKPVSAPKELLSRISESDSNKLYSGTQKSIDEAVKINSEILISKTMPAIERYTGVVYDAINYSTLDTESKRYFNSHVRIISGLFGLVKPQQHIPNYKLKIDKLQVAKYWKESISDKLKNTFVIDLLPQTHKKAVSYENGIEVEFIITKNDKKKPAGHFGKKVKGTFVRWLVENQVVDVKRMKEFSSEGFKFKKEKENKKINYIVFEKKK